MSDEEYCESLIKAALSAAMVIYDKHGFKEWAVAWISGEDRDRTHAKIMWDACGGGSYIRHTGPAKWAAATAIDAAMFKLGTARWSVMRLCAESLRYSAWALSDMQREEQFIAELHSAKEEKTPYHVDTSSNSVQIQSIPPGHAVVIKPA